MNFSNLPKDLKYLIYDYDKPTEKYTNVILELQRIHEAVDFFLYPDENYIIFPSKMYKNMNDYIYFFCEYCGVRLNDIYDLCIYCFFGMLIIYICE